MSDPLGLFLIGKFDSSCARFSVFSTIRYTGKGSFLLEIRYVTGEFILIFRHINPFSHVIRYRPNVLQGGRVAENEELTANLKLVHIFTVPISLIFVRGQAAYMKSRGFSVDVISSPGRELDAFAMQEGATPYAVEMTRSIKPLRDLPALFRLWRIFRSVRPRIVHAHTPKGGLLGTIAAFLAGVPVRIYHIHGLRFLTAEGLKRSLLRWTEWISCSLAHQVFCVSPSVREVAITEGICKAEKVKVILRGSSNGVQCRRRFQPRTVWKQGPR